MEFGATASGPSDATGASLSFFSGRSYEVELTRARLRIAAVYLNATLPSSGARATPCALPGIYVAQVIAALNVDVLSPEPQAFGKTGDGTPLHASAAEVWLSGDDVDALEDDTLILDVAGSARRDGQTFPFEGQVTIGKNRLSPADPEQPGAEPICAERIVSPIPVDITPLAGGRLHVRIDPRGWFANVDFAQLEQVSVDPPLYRFVDRNEGQPSTNLFNGLRSTQGVYSFSWEVR